MKRNRIYIISGPNLNRLGRRDPSVYGTQTLADLETKMRDAFPGVELLFSQHNCEGDIINVIQQAADDECAPGIIINPGAYAHYSYAIADALADAALAGVDAIEVHLSNIAAREEFRRRSVTAAACKGMISGLGMAGYLLAATALL